jgi:hypothetical protein
VAGPPDPKNERTRGKEGHDFLLLPLILLLLLLLLFLLLLPWQNFISNMLLFSFIPLFPFVHVFFLRIKIPLLV